jgi:hypothetical protein
MAAGVAFLFNFQIARRYRGGKPRVYWPAPNADNLTDEQTWGGTIVTSMHSAIVAVVAALVGAPPGTTTVTGQVNVSYYQGNTVVIDPITGRARNVSNVRPTPQTDSVVGIVANVKPASQRKRNLH